MLSPSEEAWAAMKSDARRLLFDPLPSGYTIHDRFQGISEGVMMLTKINQVYRVYTRAHINFTNAEGQWQLVPHNMNTRRQDAVVDEYIESILDYGYMPGCRSGPWAQLSERGTPEVGPFRMLTFDKLGSAIKACWERHSDIQNVRATLAAGLPDVDLYSHAMPDDVAEWLINWNNEFHGGSSLSWMQVLGHVVPLESNYKAHAIIQGWVTRGGTGEDSDRGRTWTFIKTQGCEKKGLSSMNMYDRAKSLVHNLDDLGWSIKLSVRQFS